MATVHQSIWQDQYNDLSNVEKRFSDPNNAITASGGRLVIDTSLTTSWPTFTMNTSANRNVSQGVTDFSSRNVFGGSGGTGSGENSQEQIQSFKAVSNNIYGVMLRLQKTGNPTDSLTLSLTSTPGGAPIATRTITSPANGNIDFIFGNTPIVIGDTYYIHVKRGGTRDAANYWAVLTQGGDVYTDGTTWVLTDGAWVQESIGRDWNFEVYGRDTWDMSGGKEFYWEVDTAGSTIATLSQAFYIDLFDLTGKSRTLKNYTISLNSTKKYFRVSFLSNYLSIFSSPDAVTWNLEWSGGAVTANQVTSVVLRVAFDDASTNNIYKIDRFSYGIQANADTQGIKYWNGTAWTAKPVKYWNGTAWVQKPVKRWNGTSWVLPNY